MSSRPTPAIGPGPSRLAPDPDAQRMAQAGYWVTDYHALFSGQATFREGRWVELRAKVKRVGEITFEEASPVILTEPDDEYSRPGRTLRCPPAGTHPVYAAFTADGLLAMMVRTGEGTVDGWTPALCEGQGQPVPPMFAQLHPRSSHLTLTTDPHPGGLALKKMAHGVCVINEHAIGIDVGSEEELYTWWGLDAEGRIQAFVLDVSGGELREFERHQPTASDPRLVTNSCSRVTTDRTSLVRRIEDLMASGLLELETGVEPAAIADEFLAQPEGNLRSWLAESASGVAEVFFAD